VPFYDIGHIGQGIGGGHRNAQQSRTHRHIADAQPDLLIVES
jgi:hypothetical protein